MTNHEPLPYKYIKLNADTLTPIGIYNNLTGHKSFLLESSSQHEEKGRYSFIGANPYMELTDDGSQTAVHDLKRETSEYRDESILSAFQSVCPKLTIDLPFPFFGGAIGYVGYDNIRHVISVGENKSNDIGMPDAHLMLYHTMIVYDHYDESVFLVTINIHNETEVMLDDRLSSLRLALVPNQPADLTIHEPIDFQPEMNQDQFMERVRTAKEYIQQGDAGQIVLSQRMKAPIQANSFAFYRKLRKVNPSPYMFYIEFADYTILGASPESLIDVHGEDVVTNPIAGTRPRGQTDEEDEALINDLTTDQKEIAEHDMLVRLSEADLKKICWPDTITIPRYMTVERYQHVMHMVSDVRGKLAENITSLDALMASLPAGTVSGTPKERAVQIINHLEDKRRGFYGGGVGYIGFNHDLNMSLAIRSLAIKNYEAFLQTGAGIVADSDPAAEYQETLNKARSLMNVTNSAVTSDDY